MAEYHLRGPLRDEDIVELQLGDVIHLSGSAWTCRSRLQRYVFDEGHTLPFSTKGKDVLIHTGPVVIREHDRWKLVSFMPTSSLRFEKWGAQSIEQWGLKAIIGKTTMGASTASAMREHHCIHATPLGVTPNLWLDQIEVKDVFWLEELGSIEAAWQLEMNDLGPFLVDMDCRGGNYFDELDREIEENRKQAYRFLGVPEDFEYTKLY